MANETSGSRNVGTNSTAGRSTTSGAGTSSAGASASTGSTGFGAEAGGGGADRGTGIADQVRGRASNALSQQKDRATQGLGTIVEAVRTTGRQLGDSNQAGIAQYINNAADSLQRWTETLQRKDVGEIVEDVQRFGRRQPGLLIGLSFGAGLLGARFLKSSGEGMRESSMYGSSYEGASAAYGQGDTYRPAGSFTTPTTGSTRGTGYGTSGDRTDFS